MAEPPPPYPGAGAPPMETKGPYPPPGAAPPPAYASGPYPAAPQMAQPMATTTVVVTAPVMGPYPLNMVCPKCQAQVVTETVATSGLLTWLIAGGLVLVGCWLGCCLIPFCVDELQDVEHRCPNCKQYIGTYRRL